MRMLPIDAISYQIPANLFVIMAYHRVNRSRVDVIRIWIQEFMDSEPMEFRVEVNVKLIFELV